MKYYKIHYIEEQKMRLKLLETKKTLDEVEKVFGKAYELFEPEYEILKTQLNEEDIICEE